MNTTKDINKNISNAILKIRQDNKLTQEQFAEKAGVTRQAVSRWEMGVSVPNINTLIIINEKFGVSVDALLGKTENITDKKDLNTHAKKGDCSFLFLFIGISGLISLPYLAEWRQIKCMEHFKTAYEHSYDYIFEYPISVIFLLALLSIGLGLYLFFKKKCGCFDEEKNDSFSDNNGN